MTVYVVIVAAMSRGNVLGLNNRIPWHLPADLKHFKELTLGHTVVMGRKTWDSLPLAFRPLPGRRNLVLSRQSDWTAAGAVRVGSLEDTFDMVTGEELLFVIGGAELYALALPYADRLELTEIDAEFPGDACFPRIDAAAWDEVARQHHRDPNGVCYSFVTYVRRG